MSAEKYSATWIAQQVEDKGADRLLHHDCSFCGYWTRYLFRDGAVFYQSSCDCGRWDDPRPDSYEGIAGWLAMQPSDELRDGIMERLA